MKVIEREKLLKGGEVSMSEKFSSTEVKLYWKFEAKRTMQQKDLPPMAQNIQLPSKAKWAHPPKHQLSPAVGSLSQSQ
ncbi:hypothetical protein ACFX15_012476 [Malus domestica]